MLIKLDLIHMIVRFFSSISVFEFFKGVSNIGKPALLSNYDSEPCCPRDHFLLQSLVLSLAAFITDDTSQRLLSRCRLRGDHFDGSSNNSICIACHAVGFSSAMKGGDTRTCSNLIFICQIWTIVYSTESEAISQNICYGG